jgi:hypothetical protein
LWEQFFFLTSSKSRTRKPFKLSRGTSDNDTMFACVTDPDDASLFSSQTSRRNSRNQRKQAELEDDIINKVLEEGLRLKRECKSLKLQLSDLEKQKAAEKEVHARFMDTRDRDIREEVSRAVSEVALECSMIRESKNVEIAELQRQLRHYKTSSWSPPTPTPSPAPQQEQQQQQQDQQLLEDDIEALQEEINALQNELSAVREDKEREIATLHQEHESEKKMILMRREESMDEQRSAMLRRALLAENEYQRLLGETTCAEKKMRHLLEELKGSDGGSNAER